MCRGFPTLDPSWRQRRICKFTENYWNTEADKHPLSSFEQYQREWNFIETLYDEAPSNNGLDCANAAFCYSKDIFKYVRFT